MGNIRFSNNDRNLILKIGKAIVPAGKVLPEYSMENVEKLENYLKDQPIYLFRTFLAMTRVLENMSRLRYLNPFSKLSDKKAGHFVEDIFKLPLALRMPFRLFSMLIKATYFDNLDVFDRLGIEYMKPPVKDEPARWISQVLPGSDIDEDMELEAEVIVVGTGAGGAAVASELAQRGNAVLIIEEGDLFRRSQFSGRPFDMQKQMFRRSGITPTIGNTSIILPVGKGVGGTTLINSGTCFRTPRGQLRHWRQDLGLSQFTPEHLEPYFKKVESVYQVSTADMKYVGKIGEIIAKGAGRLGYTHGPLPRNAPDCDGQGVCCFGCPTDAKRSTNITYIPDALDSAAFMLTGTKVEKIDVKNGEVRGVEARGLATGRRIKAKAPIVVLACGTMYTPILLMKNKLGNSSGKLGKNLSIHPASGCIAVSDKKLEVWKTIPQGYSVDEFKEEGIVLEGGQIPLDMMAAFFMPVGKPLMKMVREIAYSSLFGFMIRDTSRGSVLPSRGKWPFVTYYLNKFDQNQILKGISILSRIFLEAGVKKIHAPIFGWDVMENHLDLERNLQRKVRVWDMDLTAYHPLGTCHMGGDAKKYVTNEYGELYDQKNLFICDGSVVPPAIGVNPQITISTLATRTAHYINQRLN